MDEYFSPYKDHPVVQLARQYQLESGIGYDAVASYGLHLYVDDAGHVVLDDGFLEGSDLSFDRWSAQEKEEFLKPLNDFYQKTDFHKWYEQQQKMYEEVKESFKSVVENVDLTGSTTFSAHKAEVDSALCSVCSWVPTTMGAVPS